MSVSVLQLKYVVERAVEAIGPDVCAAGGVDELPGNRHSIAGLTDAAFEDETNTQFAGHLFHMDRTAFERKAGVAGDDE
jgi:hypothetical protein